MTHYIYVVALNRAEAFNYFSKGVWEKDLEAAKRLQTSTNVAPGHKVYVFKFTYKEYKE